MVTRRVHCGGAFGVAVRRLLRRHAGERLSLDGFIGGACAGCNHARERGARLFLIVPRRA